MASLEDAFAATQVMLEASFIKVRIEIKHNVLIPQERREV